MHKLKVYNVVATADVNPEVVDDLGCAEWEAYDKSEVDKEIKDIVQGAISMFRESSCCRGLDLKLSLGQIADAAFRHWNQVENTLSNNRRLRLDKDYLLYSNKQLRDELKIEIKDFNLMYNVEYASGFHFFRTRKEAEEY